jgi:tetratricopeptide (TPR) repeat protein
VLSRALSSGILAALFIIGAADRPRAVGPHATLPGSGHRAGDPLGPQGTPQGLAHDHQRPPAFPALPELARRPLPLRTGIGSAHDAVSTPSREAQAFYDQGLAYLHSYVWLEAARSFNQALRLDPDLAVAFAQLSIAYTELNDQAAASEALTRAKSLAPGSSEHDRRHIEARAVQSDLELARPRDPARLETYRVLLDQALARFPDDEELWLARGLAQSSDPAERGQGSLADSLPFHEKARALAAGHFAAHHYLTHAYENTGRIDQALAEATTYAKMAPSVPHARHMLGHDLRRVGRTDEAIDEFLAADELETAYFKAEGVPIEYDWHYQHNLDLLATSYEYLGRMARAEELMKTSFAIESALVVQEFNKREWPVFLLSRGRAQEALDAALVLAGHRSPLVGATGHVMAGEARLAMAQYQAAADEANAALRLMRNTEGAGLVANALKQLQGEFFLRTGQRERGRTLLEEVAREARAAPGPDAWTQALFTLEAIARAAREVGDWELADWSSRQMVEHDPHYGGTHYALALLAGHRRDRAKEREEFEQARQAWKNADPDLAEMQTIRSKS